MINDFRVLALIVARAGSKGLPGKNVRQLKGRPLVAWSVEAALQSKYVDRVVISSDSEEIISAAVGAGAEAPFIRSSKLATDEIGSVPVALDALDKIDEEFDLLVLLQPTSPLRTGEDIDRCLEVCVKNDVPSVVSVSETAKSPYLAFSLYEDGRLERIIEPPSGVVRRQDFPKTYNINGAVYVVKISWFRLHKTFFSSESRSYLMPPQRSFDIDTLYDFRLVEMVLGDEEAAYID